MIAWGVTIEQLEQAAADAKVRLYDPRPDGRGLRFTLKTIEAPRRKAPWRRHSTNITNRDGSYRTVPGAVCWHGHREFMRQLFELAPEARLKTALADYRGRDDFELTHQATQGAGNSYHLAYGQACYC